jgi:hypothetical protein
MLFGGFRVVVAVGLRSELVVGVVVIAGGLFALAVSWGIVALLPQRPPRVPGVRRTRFPYTEVALTLFAASIVVPVILLFIGWNVLELPQVFFPLVGLAVLCGRYSRQARRRQVESAADLGGGVAVLLLRGFYADHTTFSASDARRGRRGIRRWIRYVLPSDDDFLTAERYLGPAIRASVGPLVGLGDPRDHLPPDGPLIRYYASDAKWRQVMADLIPQARAVVVLVDWSESLMFELLLLRALRAQTRTYLVIPPQREPVREWPFRRRHQQPPPWSTQVTFFKVFGYVLPTADPGPGTVIGFNESGNAVVLASAAETADTYAEAIAAALDGQSSPTVVLPTTNAKLIDIRDALERLIAEQAALEQLITENPEWAGSKLLYTAVNYRIDAVREVVRELRRRAFDRKGPRTTEKSTREAAHPAAAQPRPAQLPEPEMTQGDIDEDVVEILTAAWLTTFQRYPRRPPRRPRKDHRRTGRARVADHGKPRRGQRRSHGGRTQRPLCRRPSGGHRVSPPHARPRKPTNNGKANPRRRASCRRPTRTGSAVRVRKRVKMIRSAATPCSPTRSASVARSSSTQPVASAHRHPSSGPS